jgi:hypothetical protein
MQTNNIATDLLAMKRNLKEIIIIHIAIIIVEEMTTTVEEIVMMDQI